MMLIDNQYVREGDIDPNQLFKLEEISGAVFAKQGEVDAVAGQLSYVLERQAEPSVSIGARCFAPFECDYKDHCWAHVPDYSVYDVFPKAKAEDISRQHGTDIEKLPDHIRPTGIKAVDVQSYLEGETLVNAAAISGFLNQIF